MILTIFMALVAFSLVSNPIYAENSLITYDSCNDSIQEDFTVSNLSNNFNSTGTQIMYSSNSEEINDSNNETSLNDNTYLELGSAAGDTPAGGVYVHSGDIGLIDFDLLKKANINNIFVFEKAFEKNTTILNNFLNQARANSFNVHVWFSSFYENKAFLDARDKTIQNKLISKAVKYSKINGVTGIHLDYLRYPGTAYKYPGGTENITAFVGDMKNAIKTVNPNIILSAALMPEKPSAYYYGQNYKELAKHLDILMPMVYEGNYKKNNQWIENFIEYTVNQTKGTNATVWATISTYHSDENVTKLPYNDLVEDVNSALKGGAEGYALFRYDDINSPNSIVEKTFFTKPYDFSSLNYAIDSSDLTKYYGGSESFSAKVTKDGNPVSGATVKFILSSTKWPKVAIYNVSTGVNGFARLAINLYPGVYDIKTVLMDSNDVVISADNSINVKAAVKNVVITSSDLLKYYGGSEGFSAKLTRDGSPVSGAAVKFVLSSAKWAKSVSYDVSTGTDGFARLAINLDPGVYDIKTVLMDSNNVVISADNSINVKAAVKNVVITSSDLLKYYGGSEGFSAKLTRDGSPVSGAAVKFVLSSAKWAKSVSYDVSTDVNGFARLAINLSPGTYTIKTLYINSNSVTSTVNNIITVKEKVSDVTSFKVDDIKKVSASLLSQYPTGNLPKSITINDKKINKNSFIYMMVKYISNRNLGKTSNIPILNFNSAQYPLNDYSSANLNKNGYVDASNRIISFMDKNKIVPNYVSTGIGKIGGNDLNLMLVKIIKFDNDNNYLPNYVSMVKRN